MDACQGAPAPRRIEEFGIAHDGEATHVTASNAKHHIFVVNNSQDVLALLSTFPSGESFRITTQPPIDKNLERIVGLAPDLIVFDDMWAEDDDGWSLLQMPRMDPRTPSIPVIARTGAAREVEHLRPHLDEMNVDVVFKPFDINPVLAVIPARLEDSGTKSQGWKPILH